MAVSMTDPSPWKAKVNGVNNGLIACNNVVHAPRL
jgi:hypothetical protein